MIREVVGLKGQWRIFVGIISRQACRFRFQYVLVMLINMESLNRRPQNEYDLSSSRILVASRKRLHCHSDMKLRTVKAPKTPDVSCFC